MIKNTESLLDTRKQRLADDGYALLIDSVHLEAEGKKLREMLKNHNFPGIYLWSVRPGITHVLEHAVYVGRTSSLSRRVYEYTRDFQPHSVNDYKLHVFQQRILKTHKDARLALYFRNTPSDHLVACETEAIINLKPLLNQRLSSSTEARDQYKKSFEAFYSESFESYIA